MAQFNLYRNSNPRSREDIPLLLDVQSELLDSLKTRMVIPLSRSQSLQGISRLTPRATFEGTDYLLLTPQMAGIALRDLGEPVGSLAHLRGEIIAAIDLLITGI
ncbi:Toxin CcdB [compost metagenome]|uniref:Toxin CcdB n=1 Tax=Pseudomonas jinjuensis TaxID=198616 RepID=A0A1H0M410_9PSED|nr:CcdB family protein [Pseudomonas jinjuensis]SDO75041.1 toxin CcdB [Pseudomonas jinjuensis]